ncbi:hypothetical protein E8E11_004238 [Didymella keratinophila]|nr:hypothetical protein E8E11_004238 [Didymella keratinophila]
MSSSNEQLVQQLSTSDTPADAVQQTVQELEATEEGRAWLEATANLEKAFKHKRVISAATPSDANTDEQADDVDIGMTVHTMDVGDNFDTYSNNNSASGNFYSIPIPFISKVGIEINSDNAKRKFEIKDKYWWPAAVGAQAGTLYYDDINDLSGESACRVSSVGT